MTGDVTPARTAIAARYLGADGAARFVAHRDPTGTL